MTQNLGESSLDRRRLIVGGATLIGGSLAAGGLAHAAHAREHASRLREDAARKEEDAAERILVLVELFGGNDGLNTVVPYADDLYRKARPRGALKPDEVLKLDELRGLHPNLVKLRRYYDGGHMAIVQGVGYPKPVYSHFKSFEIWHTAREEGRGSGDGWIGRLRAGAWKDDPRPELVVHVGGTMPYSLYSSTHPVVAFTAPERFVWAGDRLAEQAYEASARLPEAESSPRKGREQVLARLQRVLEDAQATSPRVLQATLEYRPSVAYPDDAFGRSLRSIAGMIDANLGGRVYSVQLGNFDTHATQRGPHSELLAQLDGGLSAFLEDVGSRPRGKNVLVFAFSEFGRRVSENYSGGTDHGAAGPAFLFGAPVKGGIHGAQPSLEKLDQDENLVYATDFRSLYATVLGDWLRVDPDQVLPAQYPRLPVLAS